MLRLWGRLSSINVKKAVWAACECGVEFERRDAGGQFGIVRTPEFMQMNPNALIPVLEDGDFVLWESNVIVRYLCAEHAAGTLYPQDLRARFEAERWMDWQQTTLNRASRDVFWQLIRVKPEERDLKAAEASRTATDALFGQLDALLAMRPYIAGETFTMADIPLGCEAHRFWNLPIERTPRPHVERWFTALKARPAAQGILDMALT